MPSVSYAIRGYSRKRVNNKSDIVPARRARDFGSSAARFMSTPMRLSLLRARNRREAAYRDSCTAASGVQGLQ